MKKNVTYIAREKFDAIIATLGLETKEGKGFTQVRLGNDFHLYVANTKSVGRVDIQWEPKVGGCRNLGGESFGRIKAQMDFNRAEADILKSFEDVLLEGMAFPKYERPKKVQPGTPVAASSPEATDSSPESEEDAKAKRKALIEKTAREMGVEVSENA
jgi:hypothetical protein